MAHVLLRLNVKDYARFKPVFDDYGTARAQNGSQGGQFFRNVDNPNEVVIILQWDTMENARRFYQSDGLRQTMQRAGVVAPPDIRYLEAEEELAR